MRLLHHLGAAQAQERPDALAIIGAGESLRYGELEARSNRLAHALREFGCRKGDRVCFLLEKSPWAIATMLACLKAGCTYVPIDIAGPAARVARILAVCAPAAVVISPAAAAIYREVLAQEPAPGPHQLVWLGPGRGADAHLGPRLCAAELAHLPAEMPPGQASGGDPAHILFTSGSTGAPKGVVITHDNILHFVAWATRYFGMEPADRISGHSPLHFDLSSFDVYGALAAGAQLHLVDPALNLLPNKLSEFIEARALTQWFSVPSLLNHMARFDAVAAGAFPRLRRLLWCGEVLPTPALIYFMRRLPHVRFTNLYGPTEATIASSYHTVPACPQDEAAAIPIGAPCAGEELLVLDAQMARVAPGEVGDLYIRGVGLSPGYYQDPARTDEVFLTTAGGDRVYRTGDLARLGEDGQIYFIGRSDTQIKCRGYRIELGEIEAAAGALGCLDECAVVAIPTSGFAGTEICCAYAPAAGAEVTPVRLRALLTERLPRYMLPTRYLRLDRLPKNANGKIDRRLLKERFQEHAAQTP